MPRSGKQGLLVAAPLLSSAIALVAVGCDARVRLGDAIDAGDADAVDSNAPDATISADAAGSTETGASLDARSDGSVPADGSAPPDGSGPGDGALADVADAATADSGALCDLTKDFAAPVAIAELNVGYDQNGARVSADMRTIVFHATLTNGGVGQIYQATRAQRTDAWSAPAPIVALDDAGGPAEAAFPSLAPDGLSIYFESFRGGRVQIWFSTRASASDSFGAPALVPALVDPANTGQPYVHGGGTALAILSRHTSANPGEGTLGGTDFYRATIASPGVTSAMIHVPELSTPTNDFSLIVTEDGLTAFFSRLELPDGGAASMYRVWSASRASAGAPFGSIAPVPSVATPGGDNLATSVSPDGCVLFLSSTTVPGGPARIYSATRPK